MKNGGWIMTKGGSTEDSSKGELVKEYLSNEVKFTPIRKVDLGS